MLDAAAVVLAQYPDDIMRAVTHPVTGIPGKIKWPPSIYEIREHCEILMEPIRNAAVRDKQLQEQIARRETEEQVRAAAPRPSYDDLKAKHGPSWGLPGVEGEDDDTKQKRAALFARVNRRIHGDVDEWHVSPVLADMLAVSKGMV